MSQHTHDFSNTGFRSDLGEKGTIYNPHPYPVAVNEEGMMLPGGEVATVNLKDMETARLIKAGVVRLLTQAESTPVVQTKKGRRKG